ncbi:unnamed protein product [Ixodes persulcatus]
MNAVVTCLKRKAHLSACSKIYEFPRLGIARHFSRLNLMSKPLFTCYPQLPQDFLRPQLINIIKLKLT